MTPPFAALFSNPKAVLVTAETLVESMDRDGVARSVAVGIGWRRFRGWPKESNDYIVESVQRYPDRVIGFCSVNPLWGDAAVDEVERCDAAGLKGVGEIHPDTQGLDITDGQLMAPLMDCGGAAGNAGAGPCVRTGGAPVPGKGSYYAGQTVPVYREFSGERHHLRPLGRRSSLLRADARGGSCPEKRLLRHGGLSIPVQAGYIRCGRPAGGVGKDTFRH